VISGRLILIVDDNPEVAEAVREILNHEGYLCEYAPDGERALAAVRRQIPDLILLDRMLPRITGDEVTRRLKSDPRSQDIPIIMLSGKNCEQDQVVGFALGADDYIPKPFSPGVLLARIARHLRSGVGLEDEFENAPSMPSSIRLDRSQPRVFVDKTPVMLTATEYRILASLMAAAGTVLTADQLLAMVYGREAPADDNSLHGHVGTLQRKMGPAAECIQVLSRADYAFCPPRGATPYA
jgi:two-component system OmpR family response regulator